MSPVGPVMARRREGGKEMVQLGGEGKQQRERRRTCPGSFSGTVAFEL